MNGARQKALATQQKLMKTFFYSWNAGKSEPTMIMATDNQNPIEEFKIKKHLKNFFVFGFSVLK